MPHRISTAALVSVLAALASVHTESTAQAPRKGSPEDSPPPGVTRLTAFGERASWSPDGKRIAFMSKSFGDAFEIDLSSRMTRLLTHYAHPGFLRVQYPQTSTKDAGVPARQTRRAPESAGCQ